MAKYTDVEICNIALHSIGAKAIEVLGEDSKGGRACKSFYGFTRDFLLTSFDWNFARKYAELTEKTQPADDLLGAQHVVNTNLWTPPGGPGETYLTFQSTIDYTPYGAYFELVAVDTAGDERVIINPSEYTTFAHVTEVDVTLLGELSGVDGLNPAIDRLRLKAIQILDNDVTELARDNIPPGYYRFQLPDDCEIVRKVWPYQQRDRWEVFGNELYVTRSENVGIYYTSKEVNTYLFSTAFSNVLALGVAVRLAPIMAQDKELATQLYSQFLIDQQSAFAIDANAGNPYREYDETPENDTFVNPDLANFLGMTPNANS